MKIRAVFLCVKFVVCWQAEEFDGAASHVIRVGEASALQVKVSLKAYLQLAFNVGEASALQF